MFKTDPEKVEALKRKARELWQKSKAAIRFYTNLSEHMDLDGASARIRSGITFRGPNVFILAFSIVIASVGLNVNSTAVIIGAMLISPLMGPIIGMGLSMGTNDLPLLKDSFRNLLVMVGISLAASSLFFMISPLSLVNPTELEARTSPTIYDVMIAFFGGLAGIFENCRKERGTVLSGVAIATALMPPLCTAGYGIAHLDFRFFIGALYLFVINGVFIILATFLSVKYLRFKEVTDLNDRLQKMRRQVITTVLVVVSVPSLFTAYTLVKDNNFERNVKSFISDNKTIGRSYVYDYKIYKKNGRKVEVFLAGDQLDSWARESLLESARKHHVNPDVIKLTAHTTGMSQEEMDSLVASVYEDTEAKLRENENVLKTFAARLDSLSGVVNSLMQADTALAEPSSAAVPLD